MKFSVAWIAGSCAFLCLAAFLEITPLKATQPTLVVDQFADAATDEKSDPSQQEIKTNSAPQPEAESPSKTAEAAEEKYVEVATANIARLEVMHEYNLGTAVAGRIKDVLVEIGDHVKAGQIVALLDDSLLRAQLAQAELEAKSDVLIEFAELKLTHARSDYERIQTMNKRTEKNVVSEDEIRKIRLEIVQAEAELKKSVERRLAANLHLRTVAQQMAQCVINSPVDGVITNIERRAGASVRQGDSILSLVDPTVLMLRCSVVPEVARKISRGMQVRFEAHEKLQADPIFGTVLGFSPRAHQDLENRIEVLCKVKSPDEHIREGTFGTAIFVQKTSTTTEALE